MKPDIELYIDKLVLQGFPPGNRHRIAQAVERELTRLFTEQGAPPSLSQGGNFDQWNGGTFTMVSNASAASIGVQIAQTVYTGFVK